MFSVTIVSACAKKLPVVHTYNSSITGNNDVTDSTKDYVCNLATIKRDTLYYNNHHQFGDVIKIYSTCIEQYPEKEALYNNRGNVYKLIKEYDKAIADYEKAIELKPRYLYAYQGKMSALLMLSRFDEALSLSDDILKIDAKLGNIYYQRGVIYSLKNDNINALKNYKLAIKYEPEQIPFVYSDVGDIYYENQDYKQAIENYHKSIECLKKAEKNNVYLLDYSAGDVFYKLGLAYIMVSDYAKAIGCLDVAYKHYEAAGNKDKQKKVVDLIIKVGEYYKRQEK